MAAGQGQGNGVYGTGGAGSAGSFLYGAGTGGAAGSGGAGNTSPTGTPIEYRSSTQSGAASANWTTWTLYSEVS